VYLHGLIRAEDGKKMSKSRPESIIDPLDVIPKYGTDALRMALIMGVSPGNDQAWGWGKIEANRNFCNKIWNIARYIEGLVGDDYKPAEVRANSAADHWVLSKLQHSTEVISTHLDNYRFSEAYDVLYHFVWDDFADWYVEASKAQQNLPLLAHCLESILIIAQPFAPFLTETIWQTLAWEGDSLLALRAWPKIASSDAKRAGEFEEIQHIITETRYLLKALKATGITLYYSDEPAIRDNAELIRRMARLEAVEEVKDGTGIYLTSTSYRCWLNIDSQAAAGYAQELEQKQTEQQKVVAQLEKRLSNKSYVDNAPKEIVTQTKEQLAEAKQLLENLEAEHTRFSRS
jgi:valyl-tRNA synthetase